MGMVIFQDEIVPHVGKIKGATISISPGRGQISFSKEATELMALEPGKKFIELGYDAASKHLCFIVTDVKKKNTADIDSLKVSKNQVSYNLIHVASVLKKLSEIPSEGSFKYQISKHDEGYFYVDLTKGTLIPKVKSKKKTKE